ncbi:hypothetical protein BT96DRAFT_1008411 [Gymnopus androsaceus JB14]|uniref:RRM domain-containing protein n=1 Tax=Gymnopus androsaceus JB14 TaxID=1447944 RepID=A0A6A4GFJ7_9AGAR|nr:hypothetical protein BT96DRAFT_1008411 [Gymnopus androsaceus JB14]
MLNLFGPLGFLIVTFTTKLPQTAFIDFGDLQARYGQHEALKALELEKHTTNNVQCRLSNKQRINSSTLSLPLTSLPNSVVIPTFRPPLPTASTLNDVSHSHVIRASPKPTLGTIDVYSGSDIDTESESLDADAGAGKNPSSLTSTPQPPVFSQGSAFKLNPIPDLPPCPMTYSIPPHPASHSQSQSQSCQCPVEDMVTFEVKVKIMRGAKPREERVGRCMFKVSTPVSVSLPLAFAFTLEVTLSPTGGYGQARISAYTRHMVHTVYTPQTQNVCDWKTCMPRKFDPILRSQTQSPSSTSTSGLPRASTSLNMARDSTSSG